MFQDEGQEVTTCLDHSDKQGGREEQSLMCILSSSVASGYKYSFILLQPKINLLLLVKTKILRTYFHLKLESNIDSISLYHQKLDCEKQSPHVHQTYWGSSF